MRERDLDAVGVERLLEPSAILSPDRLLSERDGLEPCLDRDLGLLEIIDTEDLDLFQDGRSEARVLAERFGHFLRDLEMRACGILAADTMSPARRLVAHGIRGVADTARPTYVTAWQFWRRTFGISIAEDLGVNWTAREKLLGLRVLIIEDVFEVRQVMRWMLESKGAMIVEASTGREGLRFLRTQPFDVVLTDPGLPDMSGEALMEGIRSESSGRTSVAVVSGDDAKTLSRALELGAERTFSKPVDWASLLLYLSNTREAAAARSSLAGEPNKRMTVLVIEDDLEMRALLCDALQVAGYRAIGRPDGRDIPYLAACERFDAVILDKELPGPNGLDLLSFLRKRLPAVPVILVTAFGGPDVAAEAASRGAYTYLEKPFRIATVLSTLASVPLPRPGPSAGSGS